MITTLTLAKCPESAFNNLPENMEVRGRLDLWNTKIESLPKGLKVGGVLNLSGCYFLESLPENLKVGGELGLAVCKSLKSLPEGLKVGGSIYIYNSGIDPKRVPEHLKGKIVY